LKSHKHETLIIYELLNWNWHCEYELWVNLILKLWHCYEKIGIICA